MAEVSKVFEDFETVSTEEGILRYKKSPRENTESQVHRIITSHFHSIEFSQLITKHLLESLKSEEFTDVTFIVRGKTFKAHRALLASQCNYFKCMLYGEMMESKTSSTIPIEDATPEGFQQLLQFLYSGGINFSSLELPTILDLLGLADKCDLTELKLSISWFLSDNINASNACSVASYASLYRLEGLHRKCLHYIDSQASKFIASKTLMSIPLDLLCSILKRDSFFVPERSVLEVVTGWMKQNKKSNSEAKELLDQVRLERFTIDEILDVVRPSGLFPPNSLLDALDVRRKEERIRERGILIPEVNMATPDMIQKVQAAWFESRLFDDSKSTYTYHYYGDQGIQIDLTNPTILNCIVLHLHEADDMNYSYVIDVSLNGRSWKRVVDYSEYNCRGVQVLYFPDQMLQHVKVIGIRPTSGIQQVLPATDMFKLVSLKLHYRAEVPLLGPKSIIIPKENSITICAQEDLYLGFFEENFVSHIIEDGIIIILLRQPYYTSSLSFQIYPLHSEDCRFEFIVEVADIYEEWSMVGTHSNAMQNSVHTLTFPPRVVSWISINAISSSDTTGTDVGCDEFAICNIKCPADGADPRGIAELLKSSKNC
jgi:BTB/POZ domain-containing protein 9